jgi:heme/copper-type cytochrome/quinol oxidase subunit 2
MVKRRFYWCILFTSAILTTSRVASAEDLATYSVTLKNHHFSPTEIHVPSGKPFFVLVTNGDDTADEFEMSAPPVEKVIAPGQEGRLRIRPLAPGRFKFFDDFHQDTAQGAFVSE